MLFISSGTAPVSNVVATVTVTGLECGVTYTITAGGTLNGDLVGARSSSGTITTGPCPIKTTGAFAYDVFTLHVHVAMYTCYSSSKFLCPLIFVITQKS